MITYARNLNTLTLITTIGTLILGFTITPSKGTFSWLIKKSDPDEFRDIYQIIESRGYNYEIHEVLTEDDYILTVIRMVNPLFERQKMKKTPVIMVHGFCLSAIDYLINSPGGSVNESTDRVGNNLGFELSKRGYDVWLANNRGNKYSLKHKSLNWTLDSDYWSFTMDEMVEYDLPAIIHYVRKKAKRRTVSYVGYSQGGTIMFALLAAQPQYADIVKPFVALAPLIIGRNQRTPIKIIAKSELFRDIISEMGGVFSDTFAQGLALTCRGPLRVFCPYIITFISGYDWAHLNRTRIPVYIRNMPAGTGTSGANFAHWAQLLTTNIFSRYDLGSEINEELYGTDTPPIYDLKRIRSKNMAILYSKNDWIAEFKDTRDVINTLRVPLLLDYIVPYDGWTHADFIWGNETGKYINKKVIDVLDRFP